MLLNVFDRSIIEVENRVYGDAIKENLLAALKRTYVALPETQLREKAINSPIQAVLDTALEETYIVGTGYGRARLPFSKEHIRSEILGHGLGAHMTHNATKPTKITSPGTVFAGAELRDRLSLGDKREDIMAGLHRAIILRAMSILARSGGIHDEFTFTGGVAQNEVAVKALKDLVRESD